MAKKVAKKMKKEEINKKLAMPPSDDDGEDDEGEDEEKDSGFNISDDVVKEKLKGLKDLGLDDEGDVSVKASKPISQIKKGDVIKVDGRVYEVDAHYVLIDHGNAKEMAIEVFDKTTDKDFQIRYFNDRINETISFYELKDIVYESKTILKIEW